MKPMARARGEAQRTFVSFLVGDIAYALDVTLVVQIVHPSAIDPLPYMPPAVLGVVDFRGAVVPVVDLRQRFGLGPGDGLRAKWIVVRKGQLMGALVVDEVQDVFGVPLSDLRPAPRLGDDDQRGLGAVLQHRGRMTFVVELARMQPLLEAVDAQPSAMFEAAGEREIVRRPRS